MALACSLLGYAAPAVAAGFFPTTGWSTISSLSEPQDVVVSMDGEMFVADTNGRRIVVYSASTGQYLREFDGSDIPGGEMERPVALGIGPSDAYLYVLEQTGSAPMGARISVFTRAGALVRSWGTAGVADGQMLGSQDFAFGPTGDIFVADTFNDRVQIFSATGVHKRSVGATLAAPLESPSAVAIKSGEVYVAEFNWGRVRVFNATTWAFVREWGISTSAPFVSRYSRLEGLELDGAGTSVLVVDAGLNRIERCTTAGSVVASQSAGLFGPDGVTDSGTDRFVADTQNDRIARYAPATSGVASTFAPVGSESRPITRPKGVAAGIAGEIYVTESATGLVKKYDAAGSQVMTFTPPPASSFADPTGLAVSADGSEVYLCDTGHDRILVYGSDGHFISEFGSEGVGDLQFNAPSAIAVATNGALLIADTGNNRVQCVMPDGTFIFHLAAGAVTSPAGVAVAGDGRIFVADTGGHRIRVYSAGGTFVKDLSGIGAENGFVSSPSGLAISQAGELIVADKGNDRIQWLNRTTGAFIRKFGARGSGPGELWGPSDVEAISSDEIVIADTLNDRIGRAKLDATAPSTTASGDANVWVSGIATITLVPSDAVSGVWKTYYRVEGGAVTTYTAPFALSAVGTTTVSFWSVDMAGNVESTKTARAMIDRTPPITGDDHIESYVGQASICASATDQDSGVHSTYWRLDGASSWTTSLPSPSIVVTATGEHTLEYYSRDVAGNVEASKSCTFTVTPGASAVDFPDAALEAAVRAALGISEPAELTTDDLLLLSSLDASYQGVTDLTGLEYAANLLFLNISGNVLDFTSGSEDAAALEALLARGVTVEWEPQYWPVTCDASLTVSPANPDGDATWYRTQPSVSVTAVPSPGFSGTRASYVGFDGGEWVSASSPVPVPQGITVVAFYAQAGDATSAIGSATVYYDASGPPAPSALMTSSVSPTGFKVSWEPSTDALSGTTAYRIYRDGALVSTVSTTWVTLDHLSPGTVYAVGVEAVDAVGNVSARATMNAGTTMLAGGTAVPAGSNVEVALPGGGTLLFSSVATPGAVYVTPIEPRTQPSGTEFRILHDAYFDIHVDAGFTNPVTITLPYDETELDGWQSGSAQQREAIEQSVKLMHRRPDGGVEDITQSVDTLNNTVTGTTNSFSDFWIEWPPGSGTWVPVQAAAEPPVTGWLAALLIVLFVVLRRRTAAS